MPKEEKFEEVIVPQSSGQDTPLKEEQEWDRVDVHPFEIVYHDKRAANNIAGKIVPVQYARKGGSSFKFLKLSPDFLVSGILEADATTTTVSGTASETTLNSYSVPANSISRNDSRTEKAGNVFRIWAAGVYTTDDATATVSIRCKVGSTTYHTLTSTGATVTNAPWYVNWTVIISAIGTSGTAESFAECSINNVGKDAGSTATQTIDTTASQTISLTGQFTGGSSGDSITIRQFLVELIN